MELKPAQFTTVSASLAFQPPFLGKGGAHRMGSQADALLGTRPVADVFFSAQTRGRFSEEKVGTRGLWVTTERYPAMAGGLGRLSWDIPRALNRPHGEGHAQPPKDFRVIVPGFKSILAHGTWEDTGLRFDVDIKKFSGEEETETFQVVQQFESENNTMVYAITHPRYFEAMNKFEFGRQEDLENWRDLGADGGYVLTVLFNRLAAALTPLLQPDADLNNPIALESYGFPQSIRHRVEGPLRLKGFEEPLEFVMGHDWLTGGYLAMLPESLNVGKIFMLHDTDDEARTVEQATRYAGFQQEMIPNMEGQVSWLEVGTWVADAIIANSDFLNTVMQTDMVEHKPLLVEHLKRANSNFHVFDMHHGVSQKFDPTNNSYLQGDGFTELKLRITPEAVRPGPTVAWGDRLNALKNSRMWSPEHWGQEYREQLIRQEVKRFKAQNKEALQRHLGLKEDPEALVVGWVSRFNPYHKGSMMVLNHMERLLREHPHLQFAMFGRSNEPKIDAQIEKLKAAAQNPESPFYQRVFLSNQFEPDELSIRVFSGADLFMIPSVYEPYGLTQLESMKMGTIPVVNNVDGLKSTVFDPEIDWEQTHPHDDFGQTGFKMIPFHTKPYHYALDQFFEVSDINDMDPWNRTAMIRNEENFYQTMKRAIRGIQDPERQLDIILNGFRYVNTQHAWEHISERYLDPIDHATRIRTQSRSPNSVTYDLD